MNNENKNNLPDGINLVPIEKIDLLHTNRRNVINWIRQGKITGVRIGLQYYVDQDSFTRYLLLHLKKAEQPVYLEKEIEEREAEINKILSEMDDYLFYLRQFKKGIKPIYKLFISEMSLFIRNKHHREIFIKISLGEDIASIAQDLNLTYDRVAQTYEYCISQLQKKTKPIYSYRSDIADLKQKVRSLEILNTTQKDKLSEVMKYMNYWEKIDPVKELDIALINNLSKHLVHDMGLDTRTAHCLQQAGVYTLEDLIRYLKKYGIEGFLKVRCFGKGCMQNLEVFLTENHIMDKEGNIELLDYI